jgi:hypothetical protein
LREQEQSREKESRSGVCILGLGRAANLEVLDITALETKGSWTVQTKEKKNTAVAANAAAFAGLIEQSTGTC